MDAPLISIIMAVYDENINQLDEAIKSILTQSFDNFEFIIILDKSDNIKAEKLILEFQKNDNRIVFIKNDKNIWLAWSLNKWINIAKWKYIARMDADDISKANRLQDQLNFIEEYKDTDLLFSWVNYINNNWDFIKKFTPNKKLIENIESTFFKWHFLVHPTLFCKKEILQENQYDEYFIRTQDFELWMRLIKKYKFRIVENELLDYRIPNQWSIEDRLNKLKKSTYWAIEALNKNMKLYILNLNFWMFYLKIILLWIIVRLPTKLLRKIINIKDKVWI